MFIFYKYKIFDIKITNIIYSVLNKTPCCYCRNRIVERRFLEPLNFDKRSLISVSVEIIKSMSLNVHMS